MIRRPATDDAGHKAWLLLSQVEHARLAGDLAAAWDIRRMPSVEPRDEFVAGVYHHDDGWLAWELRPTTIDGRPREFLEMPLDESLAIWRRSIAAARNLGPVAGYAVSGHFEALCRQARDREPRSFAWLDLADEFIEEQTDLRRIWQAEQERRGGNDAAVTLNQAVRLLQFFDRTSLWFCRADRSDAEAIAVDDRTRLTFVPCGRSQQGEQEVVVEPWPFVGGRVELEVVGRIVADIEYATPEALARAPATQRRLGWTLRPDRPPGPP